MGKIGLALTALEKLAAVAVVVMPHAVSLKRLYQVIKILKKGESIKRMLLKLLSLLY